MAQHMYDITSSLTTREQRFVQSLAIRFQITDRMSQFVDIYDMVEPHETRNDVCNIVLKLAKFDVVAWQTNESFEILPAIMEVAHIINNKPPPNHFHELTQWWFAKQWRAVVTVIIIFLPLDRNNQDLPFMDSASR